MTSHNPPADVSPAKGRSSPQNIITDYTQPTGLRSSNLAYPPTEIFPKHVFPAQCLVPLLKSDWNIWSPYWNLIEIFCLPFVHLFVNWIKINDAHASLLIAEFSCLPLISIQNLGYEFVQYVFWVNIELKCLFPVRGLVLCWDFAWSD